MVIDPLNSGAARPSWATAEACTTEGDHVGACLAVAAGSSLGWVMKVLSGPVIQIKPIKHHFAPRFTPFPWPGLRFIQWPLERVSRECAQQETARVAAFWDHCGVCQERCDL